MNERSVRLPVGTGPPTIHYGKKRVSCELHGVEFCRASAGGFAASIQHLRGGLFPRGSEIQ